ncbi:hypothetical protein X759_34255 [Mesorhizobium sp. LSHC420B00]|nr:hypothetical protein X759_34255 [Mesorhizobium sp. LSHC420B00]
MAKARSALGDDPYSAAEFAERHGLTVRTAEIILKCNGPSKAACDGAARAFKEALAMRKRHWFGDPH